MTLRSLFIIIQIQFDSRSMEAMKLQTYDVTYPNDDSWSEYFLNGECYWTSKQCQFSCFVNLSWNLCIELVETFSIPQCMRTFWGFCGLIELSRKLCIHFFPFCSIIFSHLTLAIFILRQHTRKNFSSAASKLDTKNKMQNRWTCCTI